MCDLHIANNRRCYFFGLSSKFMKIIITDACSTVLFVSKTEELTQNDFKRVEPLAIQWAFALQDLLARKWAKVVRLCWYALCCLPSQLNYQQKVGIMYCKAGQSTEEEMYNNESAGPAFEEFLQLLGERVRLKGFEKYRAQLDTKSKKYMYPPTRFVFLLLCWCSLANLPIKLTVGSSWWWRRRSPRGRSVAPEQCRP